MNDLNSNCLIAIIISIFAQGSYAQTTNSDIRNFVNDYLNRNVGNVTEYVLEIYADKVDFYKAGVVDKNFITKDKKDYFAKWPYRKYELTSDINVSKSDVHKQWEAEFNYSYYVANKTRNLEGEAWCKLTIKEEERLKIVGENGGLVKKTNEQKPPKQTVQESAGIKLSVLSIEDPTEPSVFFKSSYSSRLIGINVSLQNNSKNSHQLKISNFLLEDSNGRSYDPSLGSAKIQIKDGELKVKQKSSGLIPFVIRTDANIKYLNYRLENSNDNLIIELQ
jgi:hypothetical protein